MDAEIAKGVPVQEIVERELRRVLKPKKVEVVASLVARALRDMVDPVAISEAVRERCFMTEDDHWTELHDRWCKGESPRLDTEQAVLRSLRGRTALSAPRAAIVLETMRSAARNAANEAAGSSAANTVAEFQYGLCDRAWNEVIHAYVYGLSREELSGFIGAKVPKVQDVAFRANVTLLSSALKLTEPDLFKEIILNPPVDPVVAMISGKVEFNPEIATAPGGRDWGDDSAAMGEDGLDQPDLLDLPGSPGPRGETEHQADYQRRVHDFLVTCVKGSRVVLSHLAERPDLILDHVKPDGQPDKEAIARVVRERDLSSGGNVDARVRRAYVAYQRLLVYHGFTVGAPLLDGGRLGSPHVIPPGVDEAGLPIAATLRREIEGADLRTIAEAEGAAWPGPDRPAEEWECVRDVMVRLRVERSALRAALDERLVVCLHERGVVEPPPELPDRLRAFDGGRTPASPRPVPDPEAAAEVGRVIAVPRSAVIVEAKASEAESMRPEHALPLPEPLHKRHRGTWWYFPEGGLDV